MKRDMVLKPEGPTTENAQTLPETIWHSYDVGTQSGSPQATMKDSLGLKTATLEFYQSVNSGGVDKGRIALHLYSRSPNESFNNLEQFWTASTTDPYPYAGKSNVNRGSDAGEANTPAPAGVRDLQLRPPENGHLVVAAFKVPEAGALSFTATQSYSVFAWVNVPSLGNRPQGIVTKSRIVAPWYGIGQALPTNGYTVHLPRISLALRLPAGGILSRSYRTPVSMRAISMLTVSRWGRREQPTPTAQGILTSAGQTSSQTNTSRELWMRSVFPTPHGLVAGSAPSTVQLKINLSPTARTYPRLHRPQGKDDEFTHTEKWIHDFTLPRSP